MVGQTRQWADVYVDDIDERSRLERSALFFVPSAFELCKNHRLSISKLNSRATITKKDQPHLQVAGRSVIETVIHCKQPVVYESAIRFIQLANLDLPKDKLLQTSDIVACVFRLKDPQVIEALGLDAPALALGSGVTLKVVESSLNRLRICYVDAKAIWAFLMGQAADRKGLTKEVREILTGNQEDLIRTEVKGTYPIAIGRTGVVIPRHSKKGEASDVDNAEYVYNRSNLHPAPPSGHPWTIETRTPPKA